MTDPMLYVLVVLAAYRVTRVIVHDDFPPTMALRRVVVRKFGPDSSWADLVACPWCMGWWVSLAACAWVYPQEGPIRVLLRALACAALVGVLHHVTELLSD